MDRIFVRGPKREHDGYGCVVIIGCMVIFWAALIAAAFWALS